MTGKSSFMHSSSPGSSVLLMIGPSFVIPPMATILFSPPILPPKWFTEYVLSGAKSRFGFLIIQYRLLLAFLVRCPLWSHCVATSYSSSLLIPLSPVGSLIL